MGQGLVVGFSVSVLLALWGLLFHLGGGGLSGWGGFLLHIQGQYALAVTALPILMLGAFVGLIEGMSLRQSSGRGLSIWAFRLAKFAPSIGTISVTCWLTIPYPLPLEMLWMGSGFVGFSVVMLVIRGFPAW